MDLNKLSDNQGARKDRTRIGRGLGSGKGKTGGRGYKGAKSRSGVSIKGFEGGQMPLHRRLPKRGFTNLFAKEHSILNVGRLQAAMDAGKVDASKEINLEVLVEAGVVRAAKDGLRLLGKGELKAKIAIIVAHASPSALAAVEKAGGKVEIAKTENKSSAE